VHHEPQRVVVPREADFLSQTGDDALAVGRLLSELVLVEAEDAGIGVEQRARILADDVRLAIGLLTRVRRRAEVHVDTALAVERQPLVGMLPPLALPCPNCSFVSSLPSPSLSRSATMPPPLLPRPVCVVANTSPFGATSRWRARPMLSATTAAQKPCGNLIPPLSGSQAGGPAA